MSRLLRVSAVAAALTTTYRALQVPPKGPRVYEIDKVAYEAVRRASGSCDVYCVPEGQCELMTQTEKLKAYGITEQGNGKHGCYMEAQAFGNVSMNIEKRLKTLARPCKGMTHAAKLKKPAAAAGEALTVGEPATSGQEATQERRMSAYEHAPYEAISPAYLDMSSVQCRPESRCSLIAMQGNLACLGITGQGNCRHNGHTLRAQPTKKTQQTHAYLSTLAGPCAGMTNTKFQKPPAEEPLAEAAAKKGQVCRRSRTAFEAFAESNPSMRSVYGMPEGNAVGQVQSGNMSHLNMMGEGNCYGKGFAERMQYTTRWEKHVQESCQGMNATHFQRPDPMEQKSAPEQGMSDKERKAP